MKKIIFFGIIVIGLFSTLNASDPEYYKMKKECINGEAITCYEFARNIEEGMYDYVFENEAWKYFHIACDKGNDTSCMRISHISKFPKSMEYASKACDLNDQWGCIRLAQFYSEGKYVDKDISKALEILKKSCNTKSDKGINNFACSDYKDLLK